MRFLIFLMLIFLLTTTGFSQNFRLSICDTSATGKPGDTIVLAGHVVNLTVDSLEIEMIRDTNELPANWTSSLCLLFCAAPFVNKLTGKVPPEDSLEYSIHFYTCPLEPGRGEAYVLFHEVGKTEFQGHLYYASTTNTAIDSDEPSGMKDFRLLGNYPNPFNNTTVITFYASEPFKSARLDVYNLNGQLLEMCSFDDFSPGMHQIKYQATQDMPSHIYFYRLVGEIAGGRACQAYGKFTLIK